MSAQRRPNKRVTFLMVALVVGLSVLHWCLGTFYTRFEDMQQLGLAVQLPDGYTLVSTTKSHPNPTLFFGTHPEVTSTYETSRPFDTVCDDLKRVAMGMGELKGDTREGRACAFGTIIAAGWDARLLGGWNYTLIVGAVEQNGRVSVQITVKE